MWAQSHVVANRVPVGRATDLLWPNPCSNFLVVQVSKFRYTSTMICVENIPPQNPSFTLATVFLVGEASSSLPDQGLKESLCAQKTDTDFASGSKRESKTDLAPWPM